MEQKPVWDRLIVRCRALIGSALTAALLVVCPPLSAQSASDGGDPAVRGKAIFDGKGACQSCHRVSAVGSRIGPDLTSIGAALSADALTKALTDPNAALRPAVRSIRAVTKDGKVVVGLRLNEDRYTVQFIDEQERLRSLTKSNLREYAILTTARMPSYREKLTPTEIADVVSYLRSLKNP
jgi:putative heme-binding domain-containing protein